MRKYVHLKRQFPKFISLNQLYQICHISKRSASYLLQNGIIPCVQNQDHKTWRYRVALDDVIAYLIRREQEGSLIPVGAMTSKKDRQHCEKPPFYSATEHQRLAYFKKLYATCPEALTVAEMAAVTGLCKATIRRFIKEQKLEAIVAHGIHYSLKIRFLEFMASEHFLNCHGRSAVYRSIINGFTLPSQR
ncbi:helix-turn-helix domain-containing protein [Ruminococcaceae bacterium OttesenSCG-928-A11]|nr:helix-turn-helix domain-containing protein [Ruminococcaceae bacterium OttesenSCG-928-A11]